MKKIICLLSVLNTVSASTSPKPLNPEAAPYFPKNVIAHYAQLPLDVLILHLDDPSHQKYRDLIQELIQNREEELTLYKAKLEKGAHFYDDSEKPLKKIKPLTPKRPQTPYPHHYEDLENNVPILVLPDFIRNK
jgi:hypothetical protein